MHHNFSAKPSLLPQNSSNIEKAVNNAPQPLATLRQVLQSLIAKFKNFRNFYIVEVAELLVKLCSTNGKKRY